ncbi:MgtC/SapB family protein [Streptomyces decoyicus]|uniref:MgtC/SapB family protein n=1 Tax=Streptomyces decoyicus TaxID=249567 RepID=UPI0033E4E80A
MEREARQKSAGLRTHTRRCGQRAVHGGVGPRLQLVAGHGGVALDPSRVAAQVVSGTGFIGGGLIFIRKDAVRGLTTAATNWLTCAIGMACGGGLPLLALGATAVHFLVVRGVSRVSDLIASRPSFARRELRISYHSQQGLLVRGVALGRQDDSSE